MVVDTRRTARGATAPPVPDKKPRPEPHSKPMQPDPINLLKNHVFASGPLIRPQNVSCSEYVNAYIDFLQGFLNGEVGNTSIIDYCHKEGAYHKFFELDEISIPKDVNQYLVGVYNHQLSHEQLVQVLAEQHNRERSKVHNGKKGDGKALEGLLKEVESRRDVRFLSHEELDDLNDHFVPILDAIRDHKGAILTHNAYLLLQGVWDLSYDLFRKQPDFRQGKQVDDVVLNNRKAQLLKKAMESNILAKYYRPGDRVTLAGVPQCIHQFCTTALTYERFRGELIKLSEPPTVLGKRKDAKSGNVTPLKVPRRRSLDTPPSTPPISTQSFKSPYAAEPNTTSRRVSDTPTSDSEDQSKIESEIKEQRCLFIQNLGAAHYHGTLQAKKMDEETEIIVDILKTLRDLVKKDCEELIKNVAPNHIDSENKQQVKSGNLCYIFALITLVPGVQKPKKEVLAILQYANKRLHQLVNLQKKILE
jgi:hypothetical protein